MMGGSARLHLMSVVLFASIAVTGLSAGQGALIRELKEP